MPRPKVAPQDRKRSVQACIPCRASKVRCDARMPCTGCQKRNRGSECVYLHAPYPLPSSASGQSPKVVRRASASTVQTDYRETDLASPMQNGTGRSTVGGTTRSRPPHPEDAEGISTADNWVTSQNTTQSRMLLNAKGEKLYVGGTASLSYLHFLRHVLKRHMGPSAFTENDFNNFMLEVEPLPQRNDDLVELDGSQKHQLIQCYFEATNGVLDLVVKDEMLQYLATGSPSSDDGTYDKRLAIFHFVLAIGAQCRGAYAADVTFAEKYFSRVQRVAFDGMLCDPNLDMVKQFTLMAFYMLGACRRNAAFMYIGVAAKAAYALGLHRKDQHLFFSEEECHERLQTYKSVYVIDAVVSAILGRPGNISSERQFDEPGCNSGSTTAFDATFDLCALLDTIHQRLWKPETLGFDETEALLTDLSKWMQTLPAELRRLSNIDRSLITADDRERVVGAVHASCVYYFSVILVTRPFLTSHIMLKLRDQSKNTVADKPDKAERMKIADMAGVCIDSAIFMSQMAQKAMDTGALPRNMCLLKAFMFASGLLLGFTLFSACTPDISPFSNSSNTADAFNSAQQVLLHLATMSPQARHYYEILSRFHNAISTYKERSDGERRRKAGQYVDQVFTFDAQDPGITPGQDLRSLATPEGQSITNTAVDSLVDDTFMAALHSAASDDPVITGNFIADFDFDANFGLPGFGLENASQLPMLWDDFSTDWMPGANEVDDELQNEIWRGSIASQSLFESLFERPGLLHRSIFEYTRSPLLDHMASEASSTSSIADLSDAFTDTLNFDKVTIRRLKQKVRWSDEIQNSEPSKFDNVALESSISAKTQSTYSNHDLSSPATRDRNEEPCALATPDCKRLHLIAGLHPLATMLPVVAISSHDTEGKAVDATASGTLQETDEEGRFADATILGLSPNDQDFETSMPAPLPPSDFTPSVHTERRSRRSSWHRNTAEDTGAEVCGRLHRNNRAMEA